MRSFANLILLTIFSFDAVAAEFIPLGTLEGSARSEANDISADGMVVVGSSGDKAKPVGPRKLQ